MADPDVAEVILGQSPSSSTYNEQGAGLPFFQGKADFGLVHPTPRVWCTAGSKFAKANDVLLSIRAPVGDVNMATQDAVIGRGVAAIRASCVSDSWFLYFALQFMKPVLEERATGSTFASVNGTAVRDLEIPYFSDAERRSIGQVLKLVLRQTERESAAESVARDLKRAVMAHVFSRGLRGQVQRDTEVGPLPASWDVVAMGSVGKIGNGSTPKRTNETYWSSGTFPWLNSAKVYDRDIRAGEQFVTEAALAECHLPIVEPGAVLMAITGQGKTLGNVAVLRTRATISQHLAYIQADPDRVDPDFLRAYLETQYDALRQIASGGGSTKGALTCAFLRGLSIPLPPLAEQQEMVPIFQALDQKVSVQLRKRALLDQLFKSLLHKIMTGEIAIQDLDLSALATDEGAAA
ncbi:restriction endonuclease subunit S [Mycobacteroides abscessus]|uniref:restriction endonuclease subunit S n=1 Tax=Mycobacteroides abscessus TaxID=36809 RepID=UPI0013F662F8|nr:restriction endonuclease subunit S [Mycobacteroides abscessus]